MNVLSLFDGISCGQVALQRAGVAYDAYYASEVDKYAIRVTQTNFPTTIQIGDVSGVKAANLPRIDLLIGGSPCQGFSVAGKQLNFDDPRSKLFFEYVRILRECKPTYFLLENVKMKKEWQDIISDHLGVQPIEIDSALVSAQRRKRLYWTNIPNITQPTDKGILLRDIVHEYDDNDLDLSDYIVSFDQTMLLLDSEVWRGKVKHSNGVYVVHGSEIEPHKTQYLVGELKRSYLQYDVTNKGHNSQDQRAYYLDNKHGTLPSQSGGSKLKVLFGCLTPDRAKKRQNGQRFSDSTKFYTLTAQDRHGVLTEAYIRKLTPVECERLQTVPDNYTHCVSNPQRYKALGNGWTVDVIAHIFSFLPKEFFQDA